MRRLPRCHDHQHALFFAGDRQVEPGSLTGALAKRLRELGAQVREHTGVLGFEQAGTQVRGLVTDAGRLACDQVVLAAGVWTGQLTAQLGNPLPIGPGQGHSVDYFPSPVALGTSLTFEDAHVAVTPLNGRLRLAGTMEFAGFDARLTARRVAAVKPAVWPCRPTRRRPDSAELARLMVNAAASPGPSLPR